MMAENAVKRTPSTSGAGMAKMRKNVAKKSTTKPSKLSDPNMFSLAAKLTTVMNGQQKNASVQGCTGGAASDGALTNGTDVLHGCAETAKSVPGSGLVSTDTSADDARKGNASVVDNGELKILDNTAANHGAGDTTGLVVNKSREPNLDRSITSTCSAKSPGQNGAHVLKLGLDSGQKAAAKSGLVITPKMNSYVRSLAKAAVSNVDVTSARSPSGGTSCSSTTHIAESTTPSKVMCNKGNLFDNLNDLSSERNGRCSLDRKRIATCDSGMSLDEVTGKLTHTIVTPALGNVADDSAKEDILMDGVDDDANLSDVDDSILDDPLDQKLTVNGAEKKNCAHAALATSDNRNLSAKSSEERNNTAEQTNVKEQQPSNGGSATVTDDSNSGSATDSVLTAASSNSVTQEKKSEAKCDSENMPSPITQHGDVNVTHRKRAMLDPADTEPKKKLRVEVKILGCADDHTDNNVDSSSVDKCVESSSSVAATNSAMTATETVNNGPGTINFTLEELDRLIQQHIDGDSSALCELQESIVAIQESTETWKRKMTELQQQVVEATRIQQQHDLRRSHLRHKVQTRNWGVQVDEQKIMTAMNSASIPVKTSDTSTMKTEVSALPASSTSHIKSLLRAVRPTTSEAAVRPAVSAPSIRPTLSESAIRPPVSQTSVLLTSASNASRPVVTDTAVRSSVSDVVRPSTKASSIQDLVPVTITAGSTITLMQVGTMLSRPTLPTGTVVSTQLQNVVPTVQPIHNSCSSATFNVRLQAGGSISTGSAQAKTVTTVIPAKKIIDLTDDDDDVCTTTLATVNVKSKPMQTVSVRPPLTLPTGQVIVRQPLSATPLQPGTFILQSSGANPGTLYLQPAPVRGVTPPRAPTYIYPNMPTGGSGTFMLQQVSNASGGTASTVTLAQPVPRLPGVTTGMLLMTRPPPPLQSAPGILVKTRMEKPVERLHPAPLPPLPVQKVDASMKLMPPKPSLKISRVQQGIVLSWSMSLEDTHAKISKYQLFAYQEGTQIPNSSLWKKIGDVKALPLPMACTLTQFQEGNKYHFAVRAVDTHERLGVFSDPSSIHLTKTV